MPHTTLKCFIQVSLNLFQVVNILLQQMFSITFLNWLMLVDRKAYRFLYLYFVIGTEFFFLVLNSSPVDYCEFPGTQENYCLFHKIYIYSTSRSTINQPCPMRQGLWPLGPVVTLHRRKIHPTHHPCSH